MRYGHSTRRFIRTLAAYRPASSHLLLVRHVGSGQKDNSSYAAPGMACAPHSTITIIFTLGLPHRRSFTSILTWHLWALISTHISFARCTATGSDSISASQPHSLLKWRLTVKKFLNQNTSPTPPSLTRLKRGRRRTKRSEPRTTVRGR